MKKILLSTIALMLSAWVMAVQTSKVRITLSGATGGVNYVDLKEDDERTSAFEAGYDVTSMMYFANSMSVLIYGLVGTDSCEVVATNNLNGQKIGFSSNKVDDHYTLTFSNFEGAELYLYDDVAGEVITVNGSTPAYNFTIPSVGRAVYANRFRFGDAPATGNLETCFTGEELQITNNPFLGKVIITNNSTSAVHEYAYKASDTIDMSEPGEYPDGDYTVQVGSGANIRKFIVTVKH